MSVADGLRRVSLFADLRDDELAALRVLVAYREQKLITMEGHTIAITDLAGLKRKTEL